jgi:hypothetical protein
MEKVCMVFVGVCLFVLIGLYIKKYNRIMETVNSKRRFYISGFESGTPVGFSWFLSDMLNDDNNSELAYAIRDEIDAILDLKVNEAKIMHSNRDAPIDKNLIIVYRNQ